MLAIFRIVGRSKTMFTFTFKKELRFTGNIFGDDFSWGYLQKCFCVKYYTKYILKHTRFFDKQTGMVRQLLSGWIGIHEWFNKTIDTYLRNCSLALSSAFFRLLEVGSIWFTSHFIEKYVTADTNATRIAIWNTSFRVNAEPSTIMPDKMYEVWHT